LYLITSHLLRVRYIFYFQGLTGAGVFEGGWLDCLGVTWETFNSNK